MADETGSDRRSPVRTPELDAAYRRVVDSYRIVRLEVFDRHPGELPAEDQLTPDERARIRELRQAEEALDELRRCWLSTS